MTARILPFRPSGSQRPAEGAPAPLASIRLVLGDSGWAAQLHGLDTEANRLAAVRGLRALRAELQRAILRAH